MGHLSLAHDVLQELNRPDLASVLASLQWASDAANRARELVQQLSAFAVGFVVQSVPDLCPSALGPLTGRRDVTVEVAFPSDVRAVLGDFTQPSRALENLVRNAVDVLPMGGMLQIRAQNFQQMANHM